MLECRVDKLKAVSEGNHSNFCRSLFSAIHLERNTISKMRHPPPKARKVMPKNKSLLPTKFDLLKLIHFSPKDGFTSIDNNCCTILDGHGVCSCRHILIDDAVKLVEFIASCRSEPDEPSLVLHAKSYLTGVGWIFVTADV